MFRIYGENKHCNIGPGVYTIQPNMSLITPKCRNSRCHPFELGYFLYNILLLLILNLGTVRVFYSIRAGSIAPLTSDLQAAIPYADFLSVTSASVDIADGENMAVIMAQIYNDMLPEVDEVFMVVLDSVELLHPTDSTFVPALGE